MSPPGGEDHDYVGEKRTTEEQLEAAQCKIAELQDMLSSLQITRFGVHRFAASDSQIKFFTGFPTYALLEGFYRACQPTAMRLIRWSQFQTHQRGETSSMRISMPKYGKWGFGTTHFNRNCLFLQIFFRKVQGSRVSNGHILVYTCL